MNERAESRKQEVDVALAVYNGDAYLPELLQSIHQQTHFRWHLYAGDDGSTDGTVAVLKEFARAHPKQVTLLPASPHLGAKMNFSRVLSACRADYVFPADQDDVWHPEKIERLLEKMMSVERQRGVHTPILVHSDLRVIDSAGRMICPSFWRYQRLCPKYGEVFKNCVVQNVVTGCACVVNRSLLSRALPIPDAAMMHDGWLALTAAALGAVDYLSAALTDYRQHEMNDVGAKRWSAGYVVQTVQAGRSALRERIRQTQRQAGEFLTRFEPDVTEEKSDVLRCFSGLDTNAPLQKRLVAAKHRLHKCGVLRTLGFYWAL